MKAWMEEVFSSIQGEGIYVGVRQLFLRFSGCNLNCPYCDTNSTEVNPKDMFRVETEPGKNEFINYKNPVSPEELLDIIMKFNPKNHHSLSLTGGEPLLQAEFLKGFLSVYDGLSPVFLETNGTLPEHLGKVLPYIDFISMDIKMPGIIGYELWQQHKEFLELAKIKNIYVKVVLTGETSKTELAQVAELINNTGKQIPLVLQPVTPVNGVKELPVDRLIGIQDYLSSFLENVRVIPQTHKILNQL